MAARWAIIPGFLFGCWLNLLPVATEVKLAEEWWIVVGLYLIGVGLYLAGVGLYLGGLGLYLVGVGLYLAHLGRLGVHVVEVLPQWS